MMAHVVRGVLVNRLGYNGVTPTRFWVLRSAMFRFA
jgi:hypothetical protein